MRLAINIQATVERKNWIKVMQGILNDKRAVPVFDTKHDLWEGAKATLKNYKKGTTHMLVLQDDVLPCQDFIKTAERIIEILPDDPITLFSNRREILEAKAKGYNWFRLKKFLMAQAYIMPVPIIEDFLIWAEKHIKPEIYFDDNRWAMYLYYHDKLTWATAPSLVEHLGWNQTTLTGYNAGHSFEPRLRMATWYIGFENSGLMYDWSRLDAIDDPDKILGDFAGYSK